jgi:hypothetical protein
MTYRLRMSGSTTIDELLPSWRRALRAKSLSERTIASYDLAVDQLIAYLTAAGHSLAVDEIERTPGAVQKKANELDLSTKPTNQRPDKRRSK